jgi:ABC-type uncharacterized transport system substrate-binding protein
MLYYTDAYPASRLCRASLEAAALRLGLALEPVAINSLAEFDAAFAAVARSRPDALIVHGTPFTAARSRDIPAFAIERRLPTFSWESGFTGGGLLMSYSADSTQSGLRGAAQVDKILRGAKPADIPVEQPTKFDLVNQPQNCARHRDRDSTFAPRPRRRGYQMSSSANPTI